MSSKTAFKFLLLASAGLALAVLLPADTLSNNLAVSSAGTEAATGDSWLAASFTTSSASSLQDITLLLADTTASGGSAQVAIYSDDGLNEPGSLLATLSSSSTLGASLASSAWNASTVSLSADSTYWVVLNALTGEVDWAYAADDSGTGTGFSDSWAASYDAGSSWFTYASLQNAGVDPLQMDVETATPSTAVAEPQSLALLLLGGGFATAWRRRYKKGMNNFK